MHCGAPLVLDDRPDENIIRGCAMPHGAILLLNSPA